MRRTGVADEYAQPPISVLLKETHKFTEPDLVGRGHSVNLPHPRPPSEGRLAGPGSAGL